MLAERGPLQIIVHIGAEGLAGYLVPLMLLLCGMLLWFNPAQRVFNSLLAMMLALLSWITSDLGGFFIGMLLALVGGALAFAWTTGSERRPQRQPPTNPQILLSLRALAQRELALTFRARAALPPPTPAERTETGAGQGPLEVTPDSARRAAGQAPWSPVSPE